MSIFTGVEGVLLRFDVVNEAQGSAYLCSWDSLMPQPVQGP